MSDDDEDGHVKHSHPDFDEDLARSKDQREQVLRANRELQARLRALDVIAEVAGFDAS